MVAEKSASEDLLCELKALFDVKTTADRLRRLACSDFKLCKSVTVL
jgi:hypothetical protein